MKTIDEIRRANLELAISMAGKAVALANRAGLAPAYISQLRSGTKDSKSGKAKTLGDEAARKIEGALDLPVGWMDRAHDEAQSAGDEQGWPFSHPRTAFQRLSPRQKAVLDAIVSAYLRATADETKPGTTVEFLTVGDKAGARRKKAS